MRYNKGYKEIKIKKKRVLIIQDKKYLGRAGRTRFLTGDVLDWNKSVEAHGFAIK